MKKQVERFYDKYSENYKNTHKERFVDELFEHFLLKNLPKNKKLDILDVGGGIGRFSIPLAKKGHNIVLTDISKGMIKQARTIAKKEKINSLTCFQESATEMVNQQKDTFDVVFLMNGILDYCGDHKKTLKEVKRVLKNGGILIGTVNNRFIYTTTNILLLKKDIHKFKQSYKTGNYRNKFSVHDFTLKELQDVLKNHFKINKILGVTNLLRKWEYSDISTKKNWNKLLKLQINFAEKKEYINNSSDFLFVCKK